MLLRRAFDRLRTASLAFRSAQGGNIAVIFALASVPMLAMAGAAVDYGLATRLQAKLQAATDATTLALCQTPNATLPTTLYLQAVQRIGGYIPDPSLTVDNPLGYVTATQTTPRTISVTAHVNSGTFFGNFTKVSSPYITVVSQCTTPIPKTFEIALVLDNTGSMNETSNGITKIAALQQAARNFVEYVKNSAAFSSSTKISIVPFAGAVAVKDPTVVGDYTPSNAPWIDWNGKSAYHWANINKSQANAQNFNSRMDIFNYLGSLYPGSNSYPYYGWNWGGCVETPIYPQNVRDGQPTIGTTQASYDTLYVPYFAPDEPGSGSNALYQSYSNNILFNSYVNDGTGSCFSNDFYVQESSACKYKSPVGASFRNTTMLGSADLGQNGPNWGCASAPLQRLTADKTVLENLIGKMTPRGTTNIHEGFMWGWRTISPLSVFGSDAANYTTPSTPPAQAVTKIIILMTDGMDDWLNFSNTQGETNGSIYNALGYIRNSNPNVVPGSSVNNANPNSRMPPGNQNPVINPNNLYDPSSTSGRSAIDALLAEACTNAKAAPANISIYTIAFSVPSDPIDSKGVQLLQNCASPGQYTLANDSNGLISAFGQIAKSIGALRISQ